MVVVGMPCLRNFNPIVTGKSVFYNQDLDAIYTSSCIGLLYPTWSQKIRPRTHFILYYSRLVGPQILSPDPFSISDYCS